MEHNTIILNASEYKRLVKQDEKIEVIKRLFAKSKFVSTDDIKIILEIEESEGGENETV